MQGRVFNAHYLTWFDMAHTEMLAEALGRPYQELVASGVDFVVAESGVQYVSPAHFDDELRIEVALEPPTTSSLTSRFTVRRSGDELARGFVRHVCVDAERDEKRLWPDDVREAFSRSATARIHDRLRKAGTRDMTDEVIRGAVPEIPPGVRDAGATDGDASKPRTVLWSEHESTEVRPGIFGSTVHTPQLTATLYRYAAGSTWEEHAHRQDQITTVIEGSIDFIVAGERVTLRAGETALLPGGVRHAAEVPDGAVTLNVLTRRDQPPARV
jgi:acyl-CoA thioester hydrolase